MNDCPPLDIDLPPLSLSHVKREKGVEYDRVVGELPCLAYALF